MWWWRTDVWGYVNGGWVHQRTFPFFRGTVQNAVDHAEEDYEDWGGVITVDYWNSSQSRWIRYTQVP